MWFSDFPLFHERRIVPEGLLRALCVSLVLHLSLLGAFSVFDCPASIGGRGVVALPLSVILVEGKPKGLRAGLAMADHEEISGDSASSPDSLLPSAEAARTADGARRRQISPDKVQPSVFLDPEQLTYFPLSALSVLPAIKGEPLIDLPEAIVSDRRRGGRVVLRLLVNASGGLDRATIVGGALSVDDEEALVAALMQLRFHPGEIGGVAVGSQVDLDLDLDSLFAGASQSSDGVRWRGSGRQSSAGLGGRSDPSARTFGSPLTGGW